MKRSSSPNAQKMAMKILREAAIAKAEGAIQYFESLLRSQGTGQNWALGLFMAKQWRRMLEEKNPDLEEVRLFSTALNNDWGTGGCGGSGWCSLAVDVRCWLESLEQEEQAATS